MVASDDAFVQFLQSLSGQTLHFFPGSGDVDRALSSLSIYELCERLGIACVPHREGDDVVGALVMIGPASEAPPGTRGAGDALRKRRLKSNRIVLAPRSYLRFDDVEDILGTDATVFYRDAASLKMARLQGVDPARTFLCHDMTVHLAPRQSDDPSRRGDGTISVRGSGTSCDIGRNHVDLSIGHGDDPWWSPDVCRAVVSGAAALMRPYAEVRTDRPGLAILAAGLGKTVILQCAAGSGTEAVFQSSIAPIYPAVVLEPVIGRTDDGRDTHQDAPRHAMPADARLAQQRHLVRAAQRELEIVRQDRDGELAALLYRQQQLEARAIDGARSRPSHGHRGSGGLEFNRHRPIEREVEGGLARAGQPTRDAADAATRVQETGLAEERGGFEKRLAEAERARRDAIGRAEASEEREAARAADLETRLDAMGRALTARSQQVLSMQAQLDDQTAAQRAADKKIDLMRAQIQRHSAAADGWRREAEAAQKHLQTILSSTTWRVFAPLRGVGRLLRKACGAGRGAP